MADQQSTLLPPPDGATPAPATDKPSTDSSSTTTSASSTSPSPSPPAPPLPALSSSSSPPLPPLPSALYDALHPALSQCDAAIESVFTSQSQLASHIDTLATLLTAFQSTTRSHSPTTALFTPYTVKLQSAKKRIKRLQTSVDRINTRLNDVRDTVRRKEGLNGGGGLGGRLSLSSIASMAQQALAVGGGGGVEKGDGGVSGLGVGVRLLSVEVSGSEEALEDESAAAVVGSEMEAIEALAPVLDKSAAPPTYGSLATSLPSPTSDSSRATLTEHRSISSISSGTATGIGGGPSGLAKSPSPSSAPSNTALLHDLLAWDGQ